MENHPMDKTRWVELFEAIGLDEEAMRRWHAEFEARYPQGHQAFLSWLGIPASEAARIRANSTTN